MFRVASKLVPGLLVLLCTLLPPFHCETACAADAQEEGSGKAVRLNGPEDRVLEERIQDVFSQVDEFQDIEVQVHHGVARLTGTAVRSSTREKAEALASKFDGVLYVDNAIQEETDVGTRVSPALDKLRAYLSRSVAQLPVFGVALLVIAFFGALARLSSRWDAPYDRFGVSPILRNLIRRLLATALVLLGLLLALDILDLTTLVGALLGTAGVIGLAVGFAFGDIVENYLAGAILSVRQPFALNDYVAVGDKEGRVIRLTSREVILMTLEGNHLRLPNATVFKSILCNYTRNPRRRFDFVVGVEVVTDPAEAQRAGVAALREMEGVLDDPAPQALVEALGDSTVAVRFYGWVNQGEADYFKVRSEAIRLVKAGIEKAGVEMPEPTYRVRLLTPPGEGAAEAPRPGPPEKPAPQGDVSIDDQLEEQIREDLETSSEPNLLEE